MKKFHLSAVAAAVLALPSIVWATDYYVVDCQTGALASVTCVAGDDTRSATLAQNPATPWRTLAKAMTQLNAAAPGDRILIGRAGAMSTGAATYTIYNTNGGNPAAMFANPVIVDAYTPTWATATDSGTTTAAAGTNTATDSGKSWTTNQWAGYGFESTNVWGAAEYHVVASNTATVLTFVENWGVGMTPPSGKSYMLKAPKPIIQTAGDNNNGVIVFNGVAAPNGGVIIRNLALKGNGVAGNSGMFFYNSISHVRVENTLFDGFGGSAITSVEVSISSFPSHLDVINNTIRNVAVFGIGMGGVQGLLVEGNSLDNVGAAPGGGQFNHGMYISGGNQCPGGDGACNGSNTISRGNVTIRGNTSSRNTIDSNGRCVSTAIVGHSLDNDWTIENNYIYNAPGMATGGCTGITFGPANNDPGKLEGETRLVVRGNLLANPGGIGIEVDSCRDCTIENNVIGWETDIWRTSTGLYSSTGIRSITPSVTWSYTTGCSLNVRNNTIYMASTAAPNGADGSYLIDLGGCGTTHKIVSNLLVFGTAVSADACLNTSLAFSSFPNWNYNLCYQNGASWFPGRSTKAAFTTFSGLGFDTNSIAGNPLLVATPSLSNLFSCALQSGSPAIDAGYPALSSRLGFHGQTIRGVRRNIGACED